MNFKLQELSFTLFAKDIKPATFHPAMFQYLEIIPASWKLIEKVTYSDRELKLVFENKVRLIIQSNRIFFAETIGNKKLSEIELPSIIQKYIKIFARINYQALSIAPSGYQAFPYDSAAKKYLSQNLLINDPWQQFEGKNLNAVGLKLAYPYRSGIFYLDINQASVELENITNSAVWFAGNFNYQFLENNNQEKLLNCQQTLNKWSEDVAKFVHFIDEKLLASITSPELNLFPSNSL